MTRDVAVIRAAAFGNLREQPAEQSRVGAGRDRQEQIGFLCRRRAARINHDDARAAIVAVRHDALEQHGMAPGRVRTDENDQIGAVEILVGAGHGVGAESAPMARDRRGHAEPGIRVDVGRADKSLHQLVGDVIILGEQLAGEIEGNRLRPIARDDPLEIFGDRIERRIPIGSHQRAVAGPAHRMKKARLQAKRLAQSRALRAEPAEIRRMLRIAGYCRAAAAVGRREQSAPNAAIRAGGADRRRNLGERIHAQ